MILRTVLIKEAYMSTATTPEFDALKTRLKSTWMAGDFSQIAKAITATAEAFVDRLNIEPGTKVLDVACGSGNLAIPAAKKGADVTGVDIADNLIEAAKQRAEAEGVTATRGRRRRGPAVRRQHI